MARRPLTKALNILVSSWVRGLRTRSEADTRGQAKNPAVAERAAAADAQRLAFFVGRLVAGDGVPLAVDSEGHGRAEANVEGGVDAVPGQRPRGQDLIVLGGFLGGVIISELKRRLVAQSHGHPGFDPAVAAEDFERVFAARRLLVSITAVQTEGPGRQGRRESDPLPVGSEERLSDRVEVLVDPADVPVDVEAARDDLAVYPPGQAALGRQGVRRIPVDIAQGDFGGQMESLVEHAEFGKKRENSPLSGLKPDDRGIVDPQSGIVLPAQEHRLEREEFIRQAETGGSSEERCPGLRQAESLEALKLLGVEGERVEIKRSTVVHVFDPAPAQTADAEFGLADGNIAGPDGMAAGRDLDPELGQVKLVRSGEGHVRVRKA